MVGRFRSKVLLVPARTSGPELLKVPITRGSTHRHFGNAKSNRTATTYISKEFIQIALWLRLAHLGEQHVGFPE